eukprot:COSAG02_NODE_13887_length_1334_cov_4.895324_1_plen_124_part_00
MRSTYNHAIDNGTAGMLNNKKAAKATIPKKLTSHTRQTRASVFCGEQIEVLSNSAAGLDRLRQIVEKATGTVDFPYRHVVLLYSMLCTPGNSVPPEVDLRKIGPARSPPIALTGAHTTDWGRP